MFFSLIFRTCIQKLSFKFLTGGNFYRREIHIDELFESQYKIYVMDENQFDHLSLMSQFVEHAQPENIKQALCSASSRTAILLESSLIGHVPCSYNWDVVPEPFSFQDTSIAFPKTLVRVTNEIITKFEAAGIVKSWTEILDDRREMDRYLYGPSVLCIGHLSIYFLTWTIMIVVCLVAFMLELVFYLICECRNGKIRKTQIQSAGVNEKMNKSSEEIIQEPKTDIEQKLNHDVKKQNPQVDEKSELRDEKEKPRDKNCSPDDPEMSRKVLRQYLEEMSQKSKMETDEDFEIKLA